MMSEITEIFLQKVKYTIDDKEYVYMIKLNGEKYSIYADVCNIDCSDDDLDNYNEWTSVYDSLDEAYNACEEDFFSEVSNIKEEIDTY